MGSTRQCCRVPLSVGQHGGIGISAASGRYKRVLKQRGLLWKAAQNTEACEQQEEVLPVLLLHMEHDGTADSSSAFCHALIGACDNVHSACGAGWS